MDVWNAFVEVSFRPYDELSPIQQVAHLGFQYDSEVLNGGHFQLFQNHSLEKAERVLVALEKMGAAAQANILSKAITVCLRKDHDTERVEKPEDFIGGALEGSYDALDAAYYKCKPDMEAVLTAYLKAHFDDFIEVA